MARKRPELDVDFIESRPMTEEERITVSEFIRKSKEKASKKAAKQSLSTPSKQPSVDRSKKPALDFIVDKLTNSVINRVSGDSFRTQVLPFTIAEAKTINNKAGWNFKWKSELSNDGREVYKLTIAGNDDVIQGLISIELKADHIAMHLLENAPFNIGKDKVYEGVAGNLVAYACRLSFQRGFDGAVGFVAKTKLIAHYQNTLGADWIGGQNMIIETAAARILVDKYFKA